MVAGGLGSGGLNMACASSAASMMGSSLKAQAMFAKQSGGVNAGPNPPQMLSAAEAATFLTTLESGMKEVMRQANWDAIAEEPTRRSSTEASEHAISRTTLKSIAGTTLVQSMPALTKTAMPASIVVPKTLAADVFGNESPEVDIHLQAHKGAPNVGTHVIRSPLVGMTVSRARAAVETPVKNLTESFLLKIPIDTEGMSLNAKMLFAQQVACVHWSNTEASYSTGGCEVKEVSLTTATCSCNHLTMFAVSQDISIPSCGDGILQTGEDCDDQNIYSSDGCSGRCTIEATYTCEGAPSRCINHIIPGQTILNNAGVRAVMGLSGYDSKEHFINNQHKFVAAIVGALAVSHQGINSSHVVVISVCYGNDCTTYYSGRRKLSLLTEVDLQINVPGGILATALLKTMASDSFLETLGAQISASMAREIGATYIRPPEEIIKGEGGSGLTLSQKQGLADFNTSKGAELMAADANPPLSTKFALAIFGGALGAFLMLSLLCMWRWIVRRKQHQQRVSNVVKTWASAENEDTSDDLAPSQQQTSVQAIGGFRTLTNNRTPGFSLTVGAVPMLGPDEPEEEAITPRHLITPPTDNSASFSPHDIAMGGSVGGLRMSNLSSLPRASEDTDVDTQNRRL